jgi:N-acetylglucosamine-6-phosphate deacetylase
LKPRSFAFAATLLGAHCEGPYLHESKKGAHNSSLFKSPTSTSPESLYGPENLSSTIKLITLAPELPGCVALVGHLRETYPHITISLGHSSATYEEGVAALDLGAAALTHVFNAMAPLHHRQPGLAGLMASGRCFHSVIPDSIHLHPATLAMAFRTDPSKCILITDSIELAGLPDGVHPGHGQILHQQRKVGNRVTIEGTDTLIGSCCTLDECVRNMVGMAGCTLAEAVRCVTENVAAMMGESKRGMLEFGRRADFVILDGFGNVRETWIGGQKVWTVSEKVRD